MKNNKILKTFCFDLDNTICNTNNKNYSKSSPDKQVVKLINSLYNNGHIIKIYTARYMGRYRDDIKKANQSGYKKTKNQLKKWKIKYHKLFLGKPSSDIYIDDKSYGYNKSWKKKFLKFT